MWRLQRELAAAQSCAHPQMYRRIHPTHPPSVIERPLGGMRTRRVSRVRGMGHQHPQYSQDPYRELLHHIPPPLWHECRFTTRGTDINGTRPDLTYPVPLCHECCIPTEITVINGTWHDLYPPQTAHNHDNHPTTEVKCRGSGIGCTCPKFITLW